MRRLSLITLACALAVTACSAPAADVASRVEPAPATDLRTRLDAHFQAAARSGFSGAVLVAREGETVLRAGYSPGGTITPENAFWIGSLVKPITASAILKLVDEGRLSTNDSIGRFLGDVPADKREITIHHLLTHSSGLPHAYAAEGITDRGEAVRTILALPLKTRPGAEVSYSNDAFTLLAAIVEIASGRPYEEFVEQSVLNPAGMAHSGFWPGPASSIAPVGSMPRPEIARPNWGYRGATGMYSTVDDLLAFTRALRGGRIVSPGSAARAMGTQVDRSGDASDIGYGWFLAERSGVPLVTHSGAETGLDHYGWVYVLPASGLTLVLLSNSPEELAGQVSRGALRIILSAP
ncbi:MAG TPA: serine hydrolase domain-containing protein [Longimicrobium sp.]|jgi:CubicO group peptidase (beta-lactamase class C family)|uniref:serine hydrolase domain-containing protein n=1 Tax=Longimicrobium sp. TaxID=2029185 RepID=UPI002ED7AC5B